MINQLVQRLNNLKKLEKSLTEKFEYLNTLMGVENLKLNAMIVRTQALGVSIERRLKTNVMRYVRLLEYAKEYKMEEETRTMIDCDFNALRKKHKYIKEFLNEAINIKTIENSSKEITEAVSRYKNV